MFLFFAHTPFVVNHTINATPLERLQQHPLIFTTNHTDRTFFAWRLNIARPPHPAHSTILLRSEIPSGMCTKLRTVAASNNRDHPTRSLYYCLFAPHAYVFVFRAHPVHGESHNQRNTTGEVATMGCYGDGLVLCSACHARCNSASFIHWQLMWTTLYPLNIFKNSFYDYVGVKSQNDEIWKSWSWSRNLNKTVARIRSGLFKMCWILPDSSPEIRILYSVNLCPPAEMSGLWYFSVRVQSWSDKIESHPVLIRKIFENQSDPVLIWQCKIMYFYFASWGRRTTGAILPLAKYERQNSSSSAFASWSKVDTAFWHFQNLTRKCLFNIRGKSTAGVILPLGESDCLDWSSDKDDTLGLA